MQNSVFDFVWWLEEVLNLLMDKGTISFSDLLETACHKIMQRQALRRCDTTM